MNYRNLLPIILVVSFATVHIIAQDRPDYSVPTVDFCTLVKHPRAYANKTIRVKATLLENHTPRVDGGDPILYDSRCRGSDFSVTIEFSEALKTNAGYDALQRIRDVPDESGNTRALVTLVGQFQYSGERQYGHLGWADSQFVIHEIENASAVKVNSKR